MSYNKLIMGRKPKKDSLKIKGKKVYISDTEERNILKTYPDLTSAIRSAPLKEQPKKEVA